MASTTPATLLVEYSDQLTEVLLGDSLLSTIRSALLDYGLEDDARDYKFTRMKGEVEAAVGQSVFEVEKGNRGFRVRLVKKGAKRATIEEKELRAQLKSVREELILSEEKRKQRNQKTTKIVDDYLVRLRQAESQRQEDLQTASRLSMAMAAPSTAVLAAAEAPQQKVCVSSSSQAEDATYLIVTVEHPDGSECGLRMRKTTLTDKLYRAISLRYSMCEDDFSIFTSCFSRLSKGCTMEQAQLEDGDRLHVSMAQKGRSNNINFPFGTECTLRLGGKPVIYLLPPSPLSEVSVQLSLIPQWNFSAIYPVVHPSTSVSVDRESIEWTVSAEPGGMLVNKSGKHAYFLVVTSVRSSVHSRLQIINLHHTYTGKL